MSSARTLLWRVAEAPALLTWRKGDGPNPVFQRLQEKLAAMRRARVWYDDRPRVLPVSEPADAGRRAVHQDCTLWIGVAPASRRLSGGRLARREGCRIPAGTACVDAVGGTSTRQPAERRRYKIDEYSFSLPRFSYLLGSIPFGFILVRIFRGQDVRQTGSGNIGATNVARSSPALGLLTLVLDALKGSAPRWRLLAPFFPWPTTCWPAWLHFSRLWATCFPSG